MAELFEDLLGEISRVEIHRSCITLVFKDNFVCELHANEYGYLKCSERLSCFPSSCKVTYAADLTKGKIIKYGGRSGCILIPDWISKITGSGRGWEELNVHNQRKVYHSSRND